MADIEDNTGAYANFSRPSELFPEGKVKGGKLFPPGALGVGHRLRKLRGKTPVDRFAAQFGLSKSTLGRYEVEENYPDAAFLAALCGRFAVSADWLLLGVEPASGPVTGALNAPVLAAAVESVEEGLAATGRVMEPGKKAELIVAVYELLADPDNKIDKSAIVRLVKTAA